MLTKREARREGKERGEGAASGMFDGNTTERTYAAFLKGWEEGDPEIMDRYTPPSWLSGEWAGESMNELLSIDDDDDDPDAIDEIAQIYEEAADEAYWHELERVARYQLMTDAESARYHGRRRGGHTRGRQQHEAKLKAELKPLLDQWEDSRWGRVLPEGDDTRGNPSDDDDATYRVVRRYMRGYRPQTIASGLTLAEAQAHCHDPETSSSTATSSRACARTRQRGPWFDGYEEE